MTRLQILLTALAAILLVVLFWLLLWSPRSEEIEDLRAETETIEMQQQETAGRIAGLEAVRDEAPEQEALLAASRAVLPRDPGLPSFLRQLQTSADDAGVVLESISPTRPSEVTVDGAEETLHQVSVSMNIEGSYFQLVDFLRRVEDPAITPRGMVWNGLSISGTPEEHPDLQVALQGEVYALLPVTPDELPTDEDLEEEDDAVEDDDTDVDVDVDVDTEDDE